MGSPPPGVYDSATCIYALRNKYRICLKNLVTLFPKKTFLKMSNVDLLSAAFTAIFGKHRQRPPTNGKLISIHELFSKTYITGPPLESIDPRLLFDVFFKISYRKSYSYFSSWVVHNCSSQSRNQQTVGWIHPYLRDTSDKNRHVDAANWWYFNFGRVWNQK